MPFDKPFCEREVITRPFALLLNDCNEKDWLSFLLAAYNVG
jgi:hypothetical protein